MLKNMALSLYLVFLFFMLFSFATAAGPFDCDDCVVSKAAFFASSKGLSSGSCGYGPLALNLYGGHVAAALPSVFRNGAGCGACFQIRCKHNGLCTKAGTKFVVTDLHTDKSNTTTFVLSSRAFRAMALPGKDHQVLQLGIANVEYKRIPCEYIGQNLAIRVEEFSKPPNYLAIKILYQGGQTEILSGDVGSIGQKASPNWKPLKHNYGAVWDTSEAPKGALQFRFAVKSGYDAQYLYTKQVLPANWKPGLVYNSTVQITHVAAHGCTPCDPWK